MDAYLTKLEAEIARVEREIADLRTSAAATADIPRNKKLRKEQKASLRVLQAKHEWLLTQIQAATVGTAKPGQVL
jgi:hypothetical protein